MISDQQYHDPQADRYEEEFDCVEYGFGVTRRTFVQVLGAGLVITVTAGGAAAQPRRGGSAPRERIGARIHVSDAGIFTVLSGKVEMGQGARGQLTQAAAEELRVPPDRVQMLLADTAVVPDDGITAGSRTTPSTVPAVRRAAAAARELLTQLAAQRWQVSPETLEVQDGQIAHAASERRIDYADLAGAEELSRLLDQAAPREIELTPVRQWKVLGRSVPLPNRRDFVTGEHKFPSDLAPPETLYGKVLRPPSYGARLVSLDLDAARAMPDVVVVRDGSFAGVAAPTSLRARQALDALARTARWEPASHPSHHEVFDYLRQHAQGGVPQNPFAETLAAADQVLRQTYRIAYVQHAPLETRVALAHWIDGRLTVWTGTQNPFGYHRELAAAFGLPSDRVRVIVPDFGSGFGGKHSGEAAIEAARLARAAGRPVSLWWTREEEFTWAYFRPAAVIDVQASLDRRGRLNSWHFVNINSGASAVNTPYRVAQNASRFVRSQSPVRQGSYRVLAATANNFARESFMDELAVAAGTDPLTFRLQHLDNPRLRAVLEEAAKRFGWDRNAAQREPGVGAGLACGTEKGSYVAACAEVAVDAAQGTIRVRRVCQVFECGAVINPDNLRAQVEGCLIMGLGPALWEEMRFADGRMHNARFADYRVPRFNDVPEMDIHLLDRPDLDSAGGSETPIMAIAPAIANAVFNATGQRIREMPIRLPAKRS